MNRAVMLMTVVLIGLVWGSDIRAQVEGQAIRVGVFQVEPLNFTNENGEAEGFNSDLLREISTVRGEWVPEFVPVTWSEGLEKLQSEEIDLMMSVTKTPKRTEMMDFSNVPVLEVWGQIYVRANSSIESVLDLAYKRVGVMRSDIHGRNFIELADSFGVNFNLVLFDSHAEVFEAVSMGRVDGGVVPSYFGLRHAHHYGLMGTAIQFSPAPVYFAAKTGRLSSVLQAIDEVMAEWKLDPDSFYYQRFNYWFASEAYLVGGFPLWLKIVFVAVVLSLLLLAVLTALFKQQVRLRTKELSESEERYRLIVENQTDLVVKVDTAGRFLYASPTYCDVFDKTEAELLGNAFFPLVHEEDRAVTEREFNKIFDPPHEAYMEQRAMTRNGWRWFSWQDSAILDESGEVKEIIGIGRDITARKEAEKAYFETAERLKEAQRIALLGRWDMDFSTGKVEWSEGLYYILNLDPEKSAGKSDDYLQFVFPDDREIMEQTFQDAIAQRKPYELEHRFLLPDGSVKWAFERGECEYDDEGNPVRAYGTTQDITSRVEATLAYKESSERLRLATRAAQAGVWEYEFDQDNLIWDEQMFKLFDQDPATFDGTFEAWRRRLHPKDLEPAERNFNRSVEEGCLFEADFRIFGAEGNVKYIRALAEIIKDHDGHPVRAVGMNWDVTKHRQMVTALTESERNYRQLFENMTTGFLLLEVAKKPSGVPSGFKLVQVNQAAADMLGRTRNFMIGRELCEIIQPLEDYWLDILSKVAMTGLATAYENRMSTLGLVLSTWVFIPKPGYLAVVISDNTARRLAEDAVLQAQQQLQHIVDNTKDIIWQMNLDGRFIYANAAAERITGYSVDRLLMMNRMDLIHPDFHEQAEKRLNERMEGKVDTEDYSFQILCRDGSVKWLELSTSSVFDSEGRLEAIQGIARDVTLRIEAEQELEESRHFLRSIIDTIPARVFWKDINSVYLGCNVAFAKDSGIESPEDLIGKTDKDLSWSETEADLYQKDDLAIMTSGEERINYEEPQTRDGALQWVSTSKVPIRARDGTVIGVLGAYQDITDRKILEEERARLSTAINQSAEAIVIMDLQGFIQYVNPAFFIVTGYSYEEAVGANLSIIKSGQHDALFYADIWKTLQSGASWNGRIINRHKDGSLYTAESAISPVRDSDEAIVSYVVAIRDVSQQVELEEHIRQAQKMDAVGRLAGGVAHDFNNILQSILGFSGILLSELDKESSQYDDVAEIRKAARRAGDLTRQLLTLSRKHNVEYAVQDLNTIIRRSEKMMQRLIGERIEFVFELAEDLNLIRADMSQIEQIILNLFINARDAMPEGGRLLVKTFNVEMQVNVQDQALGTGMGQICLEVSDTGCGIRDDVRAHLFEPFFTTKQVGEGTGLGLSVVYGIVQQHGGRIEVSSKVGEGAVFTVYLPVCDQKGEVLYSEDVMPDSEPSLEGHGETILVVEDDTVLRDLTARMLGDAGYDVQAVTGIAEAYACFNANEFDLLLLDVVLPDGSGMDLAYAITEEKSQCAILLCSGYSHDSAFHTSITGKGFRYIEKPVGSMQLLQTVREMLDEKQRG
ncbi:PAS domain S-box protein [Pontiellaceae bacterium B12219]|nr:PAS domain S-box protein [Pontiellaceae bacterium B12219]